MINGDTPGNYRAIAVAAKIPKERWRSCIDESHENRNAWRTLLAPHRSRLVFGPWDVPDEPKHPAPLGSVTMNYGPTVTDAWERELAVRNGVLEELRRRITQDFTFKPDIALSMKECGEPNAFWQPKSRRLLICYELMREFKRTGEIPDPAGRAPESETVTQVRETAPEPAKLPDAD